MIETRFAPILRDDFNGMSLDQAIWRLPEFPVPPPREGEPNRTFIGRTQLRSTNANEGGMDDPPPTVVNGVVRLQLDTFNPVLDREPNAAPSFFGTEIITKEQFGFTDAPPSEQGLAFEARVRIPPPIQRGMVTSFFTFELQDPNEDGSRNLSGIHDELTFEMLTNQIDDALQSSAVDQQILTNAYDDDPLGPGDAKFIDLPGIDFREFVTLRMEWYPDRVLWYVKQEGSVGFETFQLIREEPALEPHDPMVPEKTTVPDEPMDVRFNIWAAGGGENGFPEAFDASFQPVSDRTDNETFFYEVDYVQVERLALHLPSKPDTFRRGDDRGEKIKGTRRRDTLNGTRKDDLIRALGGNDRVRAKGGNDRIFGGNGRDNVRGQAGDDLINGGKGNDTLRGNRGNDCLIGGLGQDVLVGGAGNDQYWYRNLNEAGDTIRDFKIGDDLINLSRLFRKGFEETSHIERFTQFVQVVDDGVGNTEVRMDKDGIGPDDDFTLLVTLKRVSAMSLDASSFVVGPL